MKVRILAHIYNLCFSETNVLCSGQSHKDSVSSREILEEDSDDDGLTGAGMDKLVDEEVPHPKNQEELQGQCGYLSH